MLKRADPGPSPNPAVDDRSIGDSIGQLFDDGRAYAEAELRLLRVKAELEVDRYRRAAVFAAAAAALALAALVAFAMTLVIGFARLIGPFGGGAAAVAILGLAAFVLFNMAKQRIAERPAAGDCVDEDDDADDLL